MKLIKFLLNEISEKMKKQLIAKFSETTDDAPEVILSNITDFEKYKNGLPADRRDINQYSYDELKDLITSKKTTKGLKEIFSDFKKRDPKASNIELKKAIKKFLEIESELPRNKQDISKYMLIDLEELLGRNYTKLLTKKLRDKFQNENPNLTEAQILYYIVSYIENFDIIPIDTKGADKMSFVELEHLLDALVGENEAGMGAKKDYSDIPLVYDENNLKVFAPVVKDQCIKLRNGRTWCTSREGGSNMYYNYRLGHERTLYYVIDEDLPFKDLNFAVVILVNPYGKMSLADGSNSGRYSGHENIPWDEIEKKIPKLKGLKELFKPNPLTQEEKELIRKVERVSVGDNPMDSFSNEKELEMWLEYNTPNLSDVQYSNISPDLKKKYIALGQDLSSGQVASSEPEVLKYYMTKQIDKIKESTLSDLDEGQIALLNTPLLKELKSNLKKKFAAEFVQKSGTNKDANVTIELGGQSRGNVVAKFMALYGLGELIPSLPKNLQFLRIENKSESTSFTIEIPESITSFENVEGLYFVNCVTSVPDSICQMKNLMFIGLNNNSQLTTIPECLIDLPLLQVLNVKNCPKLELPERITTKAVQARSGFWDFNPE